MAQDDMKVCKKCGKSMKASLQFYSLRDGSRTDLCKKCLTMHVNNFEPDTFLWILKEMDVPYIEEEWNNIRDKAFAKDPNLNGMSVMGRYLSKMKLKQWSQYTWDDTEKLKEKKDNEKQEKDREEQEGYLKELLINGDISEAQYKTLVSTSTQNKDLIYKEQEIPTEVENPYGDGSYFMKEEDMVNFGESLTDEDKIYLAMKWGRLYKPSEWVELEKTYNEMTESFDIQDADTINTLILICKTNLKMNQFLDQGDIEGFQKISRVSNDLRKTAKFTAAQNKKQDDDFVDSVGSLVSYCEKNGGIIPQYEITTPKDIIDKVIQDMKDYTKELIYEDKSLAKQIEDYLKKLEISRQMKDDINEAKEKGLDTVELSDDDYIEYSNNIQEQLIADREAESDI